MEPFSYLFPFEKIPKGSRIVIYGAGVVGQAYLSQMRMTQYCDVVALADQHHDAYRDFDVPVIAPSEIHAQTFDYVVIALRIKNHLKEFFDVLHKQQIPDEKIVYIGERAVPPVLTVAENDESDADCQHARKKEHGMLVCFYGGFGDFVINKKFLETFVELDSKLHIDIFCVKGVDFLQFLYSDMEQVGKIQLNLGTRYAQQMHRYAAALTFYGDIQLQVDFLRETSGISEKLQDVLRRLQQVSDEEQQSFQMPAYTMLYRSIFRGEGCYQRMSYGGIIPIKNHSVHIPEDAGAREEFQKSGAGAYITVNFGNGNARDAAFVAKAWPFRNFERLTELFRATYPNVEVVQIGPEDARRITGANHDALGARWEMVAQFLGHSLLHIDIEGGLVHLATQLGTKCLVLFGPTQMEYYAYPENINLHAGNCHNCCGLYADINQCARGLAEPECMVSITPEMVMEAAQKYLAGIEKSAKSDG